MTELDDRTHELMSVEWYSGVSATREDYPPFLTMRVTAHDGHTIVGQFETEAANDILKNLLSTIEAADMDSAVMRFALAVLRMDEKAAGYLVAQLRDFRQSQM